MCMCVCVWGGLLGLVWGCGLCEGGSSRLCCFEFDLVLLFSVQSSSMTRLIPSGQLLSMIWLVVIELVMWFAFIGIMVVSTE